MLLRLVLGVLLFSLYGCSGPIECIEADEWGQQANISVDARNTDITVSDETTGDECVPWTNTGFILDGNPIIGIIKNNAQLSNHTTCEALSQQNSWTAWLGSWEMASKQCTFQKQPHGWTEPDKGDPTSIGVNGYPCLFYGGLGLYALITEDYAKQYACDPLDPPLNDKACVNGGCLFNMGMNADTPKATQIYDNGCPAAGITGKVVPQICQIGGKCGISLKFFDRYYSDNVGSYEVSFKSGVMKNDRGAVTQFVQVASGILCDASAGVYKTIVNGTNYIRYVQVLLLLFVIAQGMSVLMGFSSLTFKELIVSALKIAVIVQLISPTSWEFFNTYLFKIFTHGIGEVTGILFNTVPPPPDSLTPGSTASWISTIGITTNKGGCMPNVNGFAAFDNIIYLIFSKAMFSKIAAWLSYGEWSWLIGIPLAIVTYAILVTVLFVLVKVLLVFFVSYLAIAIIIALAPIFIPFMLFRVTKSLFENWLNKLIAYFIQPIIVLTFGFFVCQMIVNQVHYLAGYRVCWKPSYKILNTDIYAWQLDYTDRQETILLPDSYRKTGLRYIGFPYLDPSNKNHTKRIEDLKRNNPMFSSGILGVLILFLMTFFLNIFAKIVPEIAKDLTKAKVGSGVFHEVNKATSIKGKGMDRLLLDEDDKSKKKRQDDESKKNSKEPKEGSEKEEKEEGKTDRKGVSALSKKPPGK